MHPVSGIMSYSGTLIIEQAIQPRHKGLGACPTYLPSILRPEHGNVPDMAQHPGNCRRERALKYTAKAAASCPNALIIAETEQKNRPSKGGPVQFNSSQLRPRSVQSPAGSMSGRRRHTVLGRCSPALGCHPGLVGARQTGCRYHQSGSDCH